MAMAEKATARLKVLIIGDTPALHTLTWKLAAARDQCEVSLISLYATYQSHWLFDTDPETCYVNGRIYRDLKDFKDLEVSTSTEERYDLVFIACSDFPLFTETLEALAPALHENSFVIVDGAIGVAFETFISKVLPNTPIFTMFWDNDLKIIRQGVFQCISLSEELLFGFTSFPRSDITKDEVLSLRSLTKDKFDSDTLIFPRFFIILTSALPNLGISICLNEDSENSLKTSIWKKCLLNICYDMTTVVYEDFDYADSLQTVNPLKDIRDGLLKELLRIVACSDCKNGASLLSNTIKDIALERIPREVTCIDGRFPSVIYNTFNSFQDYSLIMIFQILLIADALYLPSQTLTSLYSIYLRFSMITRSSLFFARPRPEILPIQAPPTITEDESNGGTEVFSDAPDFYTYISYWHNDEEENPQDRHSEIKNEFSTQLIRGFNFEPISRPHYQSRRIRSHQQDSSRSNSISNSISSKTEDGISSIGKESEDPKFVPKSYKTKKNTEDVVEISDADELATTKIYQDAFIVDESLKGILLDSSKRKIMQATRFQISNPTEYEKSALDHKNLLYSANMGGLLRLTTDRYGTAVVPTKRPF